MADKSDFIYRVAELADLQQLKELSVISYGQYAKVLGPDHSVTLHRSLNDENKLTELLKISKCYVCVDKNKIIGMGYIILSGNPWGFFKEEWSYIRLVGVAPKYSGQGIAKKLTGLCINHAKENKEKVIALHTSEYMDAARHIYESLGFKKVQELEKRYGKRYWLYMLEL